MTKYQYETVQIPKKVRVDKKDKGNEAGAYLRDILNQKAEENWEFVSIERMCFSTSPGCLGALFGQKKKIIEHQIILFRREMD